MDRAISLFDTDSKRGLSLIGLPFGFSLLLLAAPLILIFFLVSGDRIILFLKEVLV